MHKTIKLQEGWWYEVWTHPEFPRQCWVSPPSELHSLSVEPDYSSSPGATPVRVTWRSHKLNTGLTSHIQKPTLKSTSTMKSQPIKSKSPRRQSNLDFTAKKHWVMICCMRFWCMKKENTSVYTSQDHCADQLQQWRIMWCSFSGS